MSFLSSKSSAPPLAVPASEEDAAVKEAARREAERLRRRRGFAASVLTSPLGVASQPTGTRNTLG